MAKERAMIDRSIKTACIHYVEEMERDRPNVLRVARQFTLTHGVACIITLHIHIDDKLPDDPEPRLFEYDVFTQEPFYHMPKLFTPTAKKDLQTIINEYDPHVNCIVCTIITTTVGVSLVGYSVLVVKDAPRKRTSSKKKKSK
jgi:hypothetical protein